MVLIWKCAYIKQIVRHQQTWSLCYPVGSHAVVVLTVAACRPHQQGGSHHVQRGRDEGQVEGPAQGAVHTVGKHRHPVEEIHASQEAAHCAQGT